MTRTRFPYNHRNVVATTIAIICLILKILKTVFSSIFGAAIKPISDFGRIDNRRPVRPMHPSVENPQIYQTVFFFFFSYSEYSGQSMSENPLFSTISVRVSLRFYPSAHPTNARATIDISHPFKCKFMNTRLDYYCNSFFFFFFYYVLKNKIYTSSIPCRQLRTT